MEEFYYYKKSFENQFSKKNLFIILIILKFENWWVHIVKIMEFLGIYQTKNKKIINKCFVQTMKNKNNLKCNLMKALRRITKDGWRKTYLGEVVRVRREYEV